MLKILRIRSLSCVRNFSNKPPPKKDTTPYDDLIKEFVEKNSSPPPEPNKVEYKFDVVDENPDKE